MKKQTGAVIAAIGLASQVQAGVMPPDEQEFLFPMPPLDTEFLFDSGFIPGSADYAGGLVTSARVELTFTVDALPPEDERNNSAEFFRTEIILPVDTDPNTAGVQAYFAYIDGAEEGWSGLGTFTVSREILLPEGTTFAVPLLFTATTYGGDGNQNIVNTQINENPPMFDDAWFITVERIPTPGSTLLLSASAMLSARRRRR